MLEVGGELDLGQEPLGADHGGELGPEHLERDPAVVAEVLGEVDGGHAAGADLAVEAVAVRQGGLEPAEEFGHWGFRWSGAGRCAGARWGARGSGWRSQRWRDRWSGLGSGCTTPAGAELAPGATVRFDRRYLAVTLTRTDELCAILAPACARRSITYLPGGLPRATAPPAPSRPAQSRGASPTGSCRSAPSGRHGVRRGDVDAGVAKLG